MTLQKQLFFVFVFFLGVSLALTSPYANAREVWYVSATAPPGGDGSRDDPFDSLAAVEAASAPRDVIKILPSPADAPPLEGGIALKNGQYLIGEGLPVTRASEDEPRAKITNSNLDCDGGDAIVLADNNVVTNLHIIDAHRAGIAAADVKHPWIYGNLITGHNQGGCKGAVLPGFTLGPIVIPEFHVGYGAIQVTAHGYRRLGVVYIARNVIREAAGNGVILNLQEYARAHLVLRRNVFEDLTLFEVKPFRTVQAILIDSEDNAHITTRIFDTSIDKIGSESSNSDGIVFALDGSSVQRATIQRLTYRQHDGGRRHICNRNRTLRRPAFRWRAVRPARQGIRLPADEIGWSPLERARQRGAGVRARQPTVSSRSRTDRGKLVGTRGTAWPSKTSASTIRSSSTLSVAT